MNTESNKQKQLLEGINAFDTEDYSRAMELLLPLAESGVASAQCYIASMYQGGFGVPMSGKAAIDWYLKAALQEEMEERVSATAYNNLATIYSTGMLDVYADRDMAKKYWKKASDLGFEMIPDEWLEE